MTSTSRHLCILTADVCGSSALHEKLGDAEALRAVERCLKRMDRATVGYKGEVVAAGAAEITALFNTPEAALQAACEMQQRVDDLPPISGIKLEIRVGFHYGPSAEDGDDLAGDTATKAARLAHHARPGQILTSPETVAALPAGLHPSCRAIDVLPVAGGAEDLCARDVVWQDAPSEPAKPADLAVPSHPSGWLRLRHGSREVVVDQDMPAVSLGRDAHNDVVIADPRASRSHGRIERRRGQFVVMDQSTNGTYVTIDGEPEFALKGDEATLRGSGRISFGHPLADAEAEVLEFEVMH